MSTDIQRSMVQVVAGGFDFSGTNQTLDDSVQVIQQHMKALRESVISTEGTVCCPSCEHSFPVPGLNVEKVTKSANNLAKLMDILYRLKEFAQGRPDSRPDLGAAWLASLKDQQLEQVMRWVQENEAEAVRT